MLLKSENIFLTNIPKSMFILFGIIVLVELVVSFFRYYFSVIDGDLALIVAPHENYAHVLQNPFGINLILGEQGYSASNRFFAHWQIYKYFRSMPLFLQNFTNPINSLYLSSAIFKIVIHLFLLIGISVLISGTLNIKSRQFIFAALLVTPLFQAYGQNSHIGLVHSSITYAIFYSFPTSILILILLPFFFNSFLDKEMKIGVFYKILLLFFCIYLSFNGSLGAPVFMIISSFKIINSVINFWKFSDYKINCKVLKGILKTIFEKDNLLWICLIVIALFSFYIGTFNTESQIGQISLIERFKLLPLGIVNEFTQKSGPLVLISSCFFNFFLLRKYTQFFGNTKKKKLFIWLLMFCIIYTILLPFGGYRSYRPYIIRGDSYLPVIIVLVYFYGYSSYYMFSEFNVKMKKLFISYIFLISCYYFYKDGWIEKQNECEVSSLKAIVKSKDSNVELNNNCSVLSWLPSNKFEDSKYNGEYLFLINITNSKKLYRNK